MNVVPSYTFNIDARRAALVIVDMQYATASRNAGLGKALAVAGMMDKENYRFDRLDQIVIPNLKRLLAFFRLNGLRVLHVISGSEKPDYSDAPAHMRHRYVFRNHRRGQLEYEIIEDLKALPTERILCKTTFSAFGSTAIEMALRSMKIECLLFSGVLTNVCVGTTARDAADRGFRSMLVEDCCSASEEVNHRVEIETFSRIFGRVDSSQSVIAELERDLSRECTLS